MEAPARSLALETFQNTPSFFAHIGKSNTLFRTVKGLLLFVCTRNINKTCFYRIKKKKQDALSAVSVLSRSASDKPKYSEYSPH